MNRITTLILAVLLITCTAFASHTITFTGNFSVNNVGATADSATLFIWWYDALVDSVAVTEDVLKYDGMYVYSYDTDSGSAGWSGLWMFNDDSENIWVNDFALVTTASDSATASVSEENMKQIAGYGYDTMYVHRDDFKGGTGTGPDQLHILVLSTLDSTAIEGVRVSVNTKYDATGTKWADNTDGNGFIIFYLNSDDSVLMQATMPAYTFTSDSILKTSATDYDTLWGTTAIIPSPSSPNAVTVWADLYDGGGDAIIYATATFSLSGVTMDTSTSMIIGPYPIDVSSGSDGRIQVELIKNGCLVPRPKWNVTIAKTGLPDLKIVFDIADSTTSSYNFIIGGETTIE